MCSLASSCVSLYLNGAGGRSAPRRNTERERKPITANGKITPTMTNIRPTKYQRYENLLHVC